MGEPFVKQGRVNITRYVGNDPVIGDKICESFGHEAVVPCFTLMSINISMVVFDHKRFIREDLYCLSEAILEDWCMSNCSGSYTIRTDTGPDFQVKIFFDEEDDEVLFILGPLY